MVKCPFCQAEMERSVIDIEMVPALSNSVYIKYTNRYRCSQCGVIDHLSQSLRVELP